MILFLSTPAKYNKYIQPICLPFQFDRYPKKIGKKIFVVGLVSGVEYLRITYFSISLFLYYLHVEQEF